MTTPGRAGRRFACLAAMLVLIGLPARAALPAPYAPIVVEPTQQDGNRLEFDLALNISTVTTSTCPHPHSPVSGTKPTWQFKLRALP